jgi:hypothetical protein
MRRGPAIGLVAATVLLCLSATGIHADEGAQEDIRQRKPFGLGVQLLGPTVFASGYVDYFFSPRFNAELGVGLLGVYIGGKYYFTAAGPDARWFPYTGATLLAVPSIISADAAIGGYVPLGIQFIAGWGLTFSGEVAAMFSSSSGDLSPYGALKAGFRF